MPNIRTLPRSEIYGQPLQDLLDLLTMGQEPKNAIYLYTNAFVDLFKKGRIPEYRGWADAEEIAWKERDAYEKFRNAALRTIPGLTKEELPPARDFYYVLRSALRRHLSKQANLHDRQSYNLTHNSRENLGMKNLEYQLIKLGSQNPDLRRHLRPVIDYLKVGWREDQYTLREEHMQAVAESFQDEFDDIISNSFRENAIAHKIQITDIEDSHYGLEGTAQLRISEEEALAWLNRESAKNPRLFEGPFHTEPITRINLKEGLWSTEGLKITYSGNRLTFHYSGG